MKKKNSYKNNLEKIDEEISQNDFSSSNIKVSKTTNLKRNSQNANQLSDNFVYVIPYRKIDKKEIISDFLNFGEIFEFFEDKQNNIYKIQFLNKKSMISALKNFEGNQNNKYLKYKVEEAFNNQPNNLNFESVIFSKEKNAEKKFSTNNKYPNNESNEFENAVNFSNDDFIKNRKIDFNQYNYPGDFRYKSDVNQNQKKQNKTIEKTSLKQSKIIPTIPKISIFDSIWDLFFSY